ncbi:hypothetical protein EMIT0324P_11511 [Pseudomonas chlororaphis]
MVKGCTILRIYELKSYISIT